MGVEFLFLLCPPHEHHRRRDDLYDDPELYETFRMLRSMEMVRESSSQELKEAYWKKHPDLNPDFIFAFPAYNVRNTEIGAIIGRSQSPRLDENNRLRTRNRQNFYRESGSQIPYGF